MDFDALKTELSDVGFSRLTAAQRGILINRAMHELDELEPWPYREDSATGTAPLEITDLGEVDIVFDFSSGQGAPLQRRTFHELMMEYGNLEYAGTGTPWFWYKATPAGVPTVAVYPGTGTSIGVQYWKVGPDLSAGADEPLAPARFHGLIVLIAQRMATAWKADRAQAESIQVEVDRWVGRMRLALLPDEGQAWQIMTGASVDG